MIEIRWLNNNIKKGTDNKILEANDIHVTIFQVLRTNIAHYGAILERIAAVTGDTRAGRSMIDNLAFGELSADTGTWIFASRLYTSEKSRAIRIDDAFGSASLVRIADVIWQTRTRSSALLFLADGVKAARRWFAG